MQSILIQLTAISRITTVGEIENILTILRQSIVELKTEKNKGTLRDLLTPLPESKTKTKILDKLQ